MTDSVKRSIYLDGIMNSERGYIQYGCFQILEHPLKTTGQEFFLEKLHINSVICLYMKKKYRNDQEIKMKIILLMVMTADGMIARNSSQIVDWSGKEDKKYFVKVTRKAGVMIMGSKTFDMIGKVLPDRQNIVMTRDKSRKSHKKNLIFTDQSPGTIISELHDQGFKTAVLIGGSIINSLFLKAGLIDEIHVTIVPRLFGKGLSLFDHFFDTQLKLINVKQLDRDHILLKYKIIN